MTTQPTTRRNLDGYGTPAIEWDRVEQQLNTTVPQAPGTGGPARHTAWLTTLGPGGAPHVRPLGVAHHDGHWYFTSSAESQKFRNLAADQRCVLSLATEPFDLVVEGVATQVTGDAELTAMASAFGSWPARVEGDALTAEFYAPSGGKPPYYVFRVEPARVYAFGTAQPGGATRFDL
jgi:Pyridoxamine 5'-phosphate oxidase